MRKVQTQSKDVGELMQGASFITIKRGADVSWPFKLLFKVADFHKDLCVNINSQNVRTRDP